MNMWHGELVYYGVQTNKLCTLQLQIIHTFKAAFWSLMASLI